MFTPFKPSSLFQLGKCCAKLLAGCSRVKYLPSKCAFMHFWAERSAMCMSSCTYFFFDLSLIWFNSDGIPVGFDSSLKGRGGFKTWGMGISRALEKVAEFGAKCSKSASSNSASRVSLCLKMRLRMSQGSETLPCGLWLVEVICLDTNPAAGEWAKDLFTDIHRFRKSRWLVQSLLLSCLRLRRLALAASFPLGLLLLLESFW